MENKKSNNAQWKKGIRKMLKRTESTKYKTSHGRIAGQQHKTSVSFCENFTLLVDVSSKVTDEQFKQVFVRLFYDLYRENLYNEYFHETRVFQFIWQNAQFLKEHCQSLSFNHFVGNLSGQNPAPYLPAECKDNDFDINSFFQKIKETDGILRSKMFIILINSNIKEIKKTQELSRVWMSLRKKSIFIINQKSNGIDKLVSTFNDLVEGKNIFEIDFGEV